MKKKGETPVSLAEKLGFTKEGVYNIMKKKDINTDLLKRIANVLEVDIREFFGGSNTTEFEEYKKNTKLILFSLYYSMTKINDWLLNLNKESIQKLTNKEKEKYEYIIKNIKYHIDNIEKNLPDIFD